MSLARKIFLICTIGIVFIVIAAFSLAEKRNASFSAAQTKNIEQIVRNYLITNPEVLQEASAALQQKQMEAVQKKIADAAKQKSDELLRSKHSPVVGNSNGKVTLVEFFDNQCVHCRNIEPVVEALMKKNSDLRVVYKEFPIFGTNSILAAKAALAANVKGKYLALHHALLNSEEALSKNTILELAKQAGLTKRYIKNSFKNKEIDNIVKEDFLLAKALGLGWTPVFFIARTNTTAKSDQPIKILIGQVSEKELQAAIDQCLETAK